MLYDRNYYYHILGLKLSVVDKKNRTKDQNTRDISIDYKGVYLTIYLAHGNSKGETRRRCRHKNNSKTSSMKYGRKERGHYKEEKS